MEHKSEKKSEVGQYDNPAERDEVAIDALCQAAETGNVDKIDQLLKHTSIHARDSQGRNVLHHAAANGHQNVVEWLVNEKKADINARDNDGLTALMYAATHDHRNVVEWLINEAEADINARDNDGLTALYHAAAHGHRNMVQYLVIEGADINARDNDGLTTLHYAAARSHREVVEWLVSKGADINARDNDGWTALHNATVHDRPDMVEWLVSKGADINARDLDGRTALHHAAANDHRNVMEWLVSKGADINARDNDGQTALHRAAAHGHRNMMEWLVSKGADINARDNDGWTALIYAAVHERPDMVEWLVNEKKADINARDNDGLTALHHAAANGHQNVVEWLINEAEADINARDNDGQTTLHYAAGRGHLDVVKWLVNEKKANIHARDNDGLTALLHAVINGRLDVVKWLVNEKEAGIDTRDNQEQTALLHAVINGRLDVVKWLLTEGGARITEQLRGENLLQVAKRHRQFGVVKLLVGEFGMSPDSIIKPFTPEWQTAALKLLFKTYYLRQQESLHGGVTKMSKKIAEFSGMPSVLTNIISEFFGSTAGEEFTYTELEKHQELFNKCLEWADTPSTWQHLSQQLIERLITDPPLDVIVINHTLRTFLERNTIEITGTPLYDIINKFIKITRERIDRGLGDWLFFQPPSLSSVQLKENENLFQTLQAEALQTEARPSGFLSNFLSKKKREKEREKAREVVEKILFQYPYDVYTVGEILEEFLPTFKDSSLNKNFFAAMEKLSLAIRNYLREPNQDKTDQKHAAASSETASPLANRPFLPRDKLILWQNEYLLRELKALAESSDPHKQQSKNLADQLLDKISRQFPCNFSTIQQAVQAALEAQDKNANSDFANTCRTTLADIERLAPLLSVELPKKQISTTPSPSPATSHTTKGPTDNKSLTTEDFDVIDVKPLGEQARASEAKGTIVETKDKAQPKFVTQEDDGFADYVKPLREQARASEAKGTIVETKDKAQHTFRGRFLPQPPSGQPQATPQISSSIEKDPKTMSTSTSSSSSDTVTLQNNPGPKDKKQSLVTNYSPGKFKAPPSSLPTKHNSTGMIGVSPQTQADNTNEHQPKPPGAPTS